MRFVLLICPALAIAIHDVPASQSAAAQTPSPTIDCYISTGDNHWVSEWLPIDSPAAIEASFDLLKRTYSIRRIYWRGLEAAAWQQTCDIRAENCRYFDFWKWERHLIEAVGTDRLAVRAAHDRGMQIWGVGSLFDWGAPPDVGGCGEFPHQAESRLRTEHPEWVPIDRHGFRRQGGPIELAYPEARRALVDLLVRGVVDTSYDGMVLLTYCENFSMRFEDEFGFSEPIVKEFKRRYGVDIRTQPFDKYAWYALRGEYVTEFMRELKAALAAHGKKLGLFVNPREPNYPQPWNVPYYMLTAGRIYLDLEGWIRDGIVDELIVYGGAAGPFQVRTLDNLLWAARDTETEVSLLTSSPFAPHWKPYRERRVPTVIALADDAMYLDRSNLPAQPISALKGDDPTAKMRVLAQIIEGKTVATVSDIAPLAEDPNLIIRRMALRALGTLKDPEGLSIIERGLEDPENAVRCVAARALGDISGPNSAKRLLAALDRFTTFPLCEQAVVALTRIKPPPVQELMSAVESDNPAVRMVALRALELLAPPECLPVLVKSLQDSERYPRYAAARALGNIRRSPQAAEALIAATEHPDVVVQDRAARSLGQIAARNEPELAGLRPQILNALKNLFAEFGDGCNRTDAEWGFRTVGNALLQFGPEGESVLREFMAQRADRRLADVAWQVLEIPQEVAAFCPTTEKEDAEAFAKRPVFKQ